MRRQLIPVLFGGVSDTTRPTCTITCAQSSPTGTSPLSMTITFSEAVVGFVVGDITISGGSLASFATVDNTVFTVSWTPAQGANTMDIAEGVCADAAGNTNTTATQFAITYFHFLDNFTGADDTNLTAHTPDIAPAGSWTAGQGAIVITSNQANVKPSAASRYAYNIGRADFTLTCHVDPTNIGGCGMIVRYTDKDNFWMIRWKHVTENEIQIYKFESGSPTKVANTAKTPTTGGEAYDVTITCNGATISAVISGTTCSYTSATFNQTATRIGLYGSDVSEFWDALEVLPL